MSDVGWDKLALERWPTMDDACLGMVGLRPKRLVPPYLCCPLRDAVVGRDGRILTNSATRRLRAVGVFFAPLDARVVESVGSNVVPPPAISGPDSQLDLSSPVI